MFEGLTWIAVKAFFGGVLGPIWRFATTSPGKYIVLAAVLVVSVWLYGNNQFNAGVEFCEAKHAKAVVHEQARQKDEGQAAKDGSDGRTRPHRAQHDSNKKAVEDIHANDQALPDGDRPCVDPVDADRLRSLN